MNLSAHSTANVSIAIKVDTTGEFHGIDQLLVGAMEAASVRYRYRGPLESGLRARQSGLGGLRLLDRHGFGECWEVGRHF